MVWNIITKLVIIFKNPIKIKYSKHKIDIRHNSIILLYSKLTKISFTNWDNGMTNPMNFRSLNVHEKKKIKGKTLIMLALNCWPN